MRKIDSDSADLKFAPLSGQELCLPGESKDLDILIEEALLVDGGKLITSEAAFGDWVSVKAVDKDNVLGQGAGFVLDEWLKKWFVDPAAKSDTIMLDYKSELPPGIYLRLTYNSVGIEPVRFALNAFTHKRS